MELQTKSEINLQLPEDFPPGSKVWIYQSSRPFTEKEIQQLNTELNAFAERWVAHNSQLKAVGKIIEDRFILLMVDETQTMASGCSIDTSVHFIQEIEKKTGVELFNRMLVSYISKKEIHTVWLNDIATLFDAGEINENTLVYNPLVRNKKELEDNFIAELGNSWIRQFVTT